jgi:hypothetical protein
MLEERLKPMLEKALEDCKKDGDHEACQEIEEGLSLLNEHIAELKKEDPMESKEDPMEEAKESPEEEKAEMEPEDKKPHVVIAVKFHQKPLPEMEKDLKKMSSDNGY